MWSFSVCRSTEIATRNSAGPTIENPKSCDLTSICGVSGTAGVGSVGFLTLGCQQTPPELSRSPWYEKGAGARAKTNRVTAITEARSRGIAIHPIRSFMPSELRLPGSARCFHNYKNTALETGQLATSRIRVLRSTSDTLPSPPEGPFSEPNRLGTLLSPKGKPPTCGR